MLRQYQAVDIIIYCTFLESSANIKFENIKFTMNGGFNNCKCSFELELHMCIFKCNKFPKLVNLINLI